MTAKQLPLSLQAPDGSYYACLTDGNGNLIVESALPTGAATSANQVTEISTLGNISTLANSINIAQQSGTQVTQITGTVPLPTGAATSANQTNASQKTQIVDGSGNVVGTVGTSPNASLDTNVAAIGGSAIGGPAALNVDGINGAQLVIPTASFNEVYNGSTWDRLGGTAANGVYAQGAVASGSADNGNPVKVGGRYNSTLPTLTNGQRGDLQLFSNSVLYVLPSFINGQPFTSIGSSSDGITASGVFTYLNVASQGLDFNGTSFDRRRNNIDTAALITLTTSSAGTFNSADQTNYNGRGLQLGINISATTAQTLQVTVQGKDIASGVYYTIGGGTAALASTGFTNVTIYPGITTTANLDFAQVLPRTWRVQAVVSGVGSTLSATVGASVIL
jgi:hypothetical protein